MSNINDFVAFIKSNGVARNNKFRITIPLPAKLGAAFDRELDTALNDARIRSQQSAGLQTLGSVSSSRVLSIMCVNVTAPGYNVSTQESNVGSINRKMPFDKVTTDLEATFYESGSKLERRIFDAWMHLIFKQNHTVAFYDDIVTDITIDQLNEVDQIVYTYTCTECYPGMLQPITLDRAGSNTTPMFSVTFNYRRLAENDNGYGQSRPIQPATLKNGEVIDGRRLVLPNAPPVDPTWHLHIVDIYRNVERVKRAIENGLDAASAAKLLRNLMTEAKAIAGLPQDQVDGVVSTISDILFVVTRK